MEFFALGVQTPFWELGVGLGVGNGSHSIDQPRLPIGPMLMSNPYLAPFPSYFDRSCCDMQWRRGQSTITIARLLNASECVN